MPGSGLKGFSRLSHLSNQQFYEERPHDSYLADRKVISRNLGEFSRITHVLSGGSGIWTQASLAHPASKELPITGHSQHSVRTLQHKPLWEPLPVSEVGTNDETYFLSLWMKKPGHREVKCLAHGQSVLCEPRLCSSSWSSPTAWHPSHTPAQLPAFATSFLSSPVSLGFLVA